MDSPSKPKMNQGGKAKPGKSAPSEKGAPLTIQTKMAPQRIVNNQPLSTPTTSKTLPRYTPSNQNKTQTLGTPSKQPLTTPSKPAMGALKFGANKASTVKSKLLHPMTTPKAVNGKPGMLPKKNIGSPRILDFKQGSSGPGVNSSGHQGALDPPPVMKSVHNPVGRKPTSEAVSAGHQSHEEALSTAGFDAVGLHGVVAQDIAEAEPDSNSLAEKSSEEQKMELSEKLTYATAALESAQEKVNVLTEAYNKATAELERIRQENQDLVQLNATLLSDRSQTDKQQQLLTHGYEVQIFNLQAEATSARDETRKINDEYELAKKQRDAAIKELADVKDSQKLVQAELPFREEGCDSYQSVMGLKIAEIDRVKEQLEMAKGQKVCTRKLQKKLDKMTAEKDKMVAKKEEAEYWADYHAGQVLYLDNLVKKAKEEAEDRKAQKQHLALANKLEI